MEKGIFYKGIPFFDRKNQINKQMFDKMLAICLEISYDRNVFEKNGGFMSKTESKDKTLDEVLADIEKQFGKGSIMKLGDESHLEIDTISSGSLALDIALGVGGYPKGRIIEIYGPESSGKTTFALHAIAEAQKAGGRAAFIDAEHALDPVYAKNLGVKYQ